MNTAERVSTQFDNDGQVFATSDGKDMDAICRPLASDISRDDGHSTIRYTFPDKSVITVAGDAWDFGYPDCYCWQGDTGGHGNHCEENTP